MPWRQVEEGDEEAEGLGVDARSSAVSVGNLSDGRLAEVAVTHY